MKLYLSGAITGTDDYMDRFSMAEKSLEVEHTIINPAKVNAQLPSDTDYEDYNELKAVENKYIEKAKILSPYFNVSILMDYDFLLPYKSSPIDGGKDIFEKLLKDRRII